MSDRTVELRVGIVSLIAIAIVIIGVFWAKEYRLSRNGHTIKVRLNDAGGLRPGDLVSVDGVEQGRVTQVELAEKNVIAVLSLKKPVTLREDFVISIENAGLMGQKQVSIKRGKGRVISKPPNIIEGRSLPDVTDLTTSLVRTLTKVEELVSSLNSIFVGENIGERLRKSLTNLDQLTASLNKTVEDNKRGLAGAVSNFSSSSAELKTMVKENRDKVNATVDGFYGSTAKLRTVLSQMEEISAILRDLANKANEKDGSLSKLLNDKALFENLKKTNADLNELILDIKTNPKRYVKFSLF